MSNGKSKRVDMMKITEQFGFYEDESLQAISLPYSSGFEATIILPKKSGKDEVHKIAANLSASWGKLSKSFESEKVALQLPKFKLGWKANNLVPNLDLKSASSVNADFSKMTSNPAGLYIQQVIHQVFLEVNEEGTEAGAASSSKMAERSSPTSMNVDRTFLFMIR